MIDRILQIIDYKGITKSKFYKDTGLSNGFLDKVKDIGVSKLDYILKAYPDINIKWLISGDGDMLNKSIQEIDQRNSNTADFTQIKLFSVTTALLNNLKIINFLVSLADKENCSLNTKELSSLEFYRGLEKFVYDLKTGKILSNEENFEYLNRIISDSYGFINHLILKSSKHLNIEIVDEYQ
ncbi:hypothetical protein GSF70_03410 [Flavobacteriaceae bacterium W22]|nr:hypothetical protein [Flavobacteriaceae bacterium W22]